MLSGFRMSYISRPERLVWCVMKECARDAELGANPKFDVDAAGTSLG